jgi:hypothetical protein
MMIEVLGSASSAAADSPQGAAGTAQPTPTPPLAAVAATSANPTATAAAAPTTKPQPAVAGILRAPRPTTSGKKLWHSVEPIHTLSFKGGYVTKAESVESKPVHVHLVSVHFVHVAKKLDWLQRMAGGTLKRAGAVLDHLRAAYTDNDNGNDNSTSTVVDATSTVVDATAALDPMSLLDDIIDSPATPQPKRRCGTNRTPPASGTKVARGTVKSVSMPAHSPSAQPNCQEKTQVKLFVEGGHGKGKLWIDAGSIPWLIAYLADEVNTGCIVIEPDGTSLPAVAGTSSSSLPATPNCSTPGLAIYMKPQEGTMDTYEAKFVEGPLTGTTKISKVSTFTQDKWDKCQKTAARWQCPCPLLAEAQPQAVARAVAHYLELVCAKQLLHHLGYAADCDYLDDPIAAVEALYLERV